MTKYLGMILFYFLCARPSLANEITSKNIGVGLGSGTTSSAFTAKKYLKSDMAVQVFLGTRGATTLHAFSIGGDGVIESTLQEIDFGRVFYGVGAGFGIFSYSGFGFQTSSIGFSGIGEIGLHFADFPLEFIIDIRPTLFIGSVAGLSLVNGGGAIRWYF